MISTAQLDEWERHENDWWHGHVSDVMVLIAEVRRLRALCEEAANSIEAHALVYSWTLDDNDPMGCASCGWDAKSERGHQCETAALVNRLRGAE